MRSNIAKFHMIATIHNKLNILKNVNKDKYGICKEMSDIIEKKQ